MTASGDELRQRLLAALAQLPEERAHRLVDEAWAEAEDAIRGTLTTAMRAVLLRAVVAELEGAPARRQRSQAPQDGRPEPPPEDADASAAESPEAPAAEPAEPPGAPAGEPADEACYVYAVVDEPPDLPPDLPGIDPARPVEVVSAHGLTAVTSAVRTDEFGPEALRVRLEDRGWLEDKVRRHETVLRHALASRSVVPMRFCTIVRSAEGLADFLGAHADRLRSALERLAGCEELGVKVLLDPARFGAVAEAESEEIRRLDAERAARGGGAAYFLDKRRQQLVSEEADRFAAERGRAWHERLAAAAAEAAELPLRRPAEGDTRQMVLNGAYLVAESDRPRFSGVVEELGREGADAGVDVELTGPWPPYTFVDGDLAHDVAR